MVDVVRTAALCALVGVVVFGSAVPEPVAATAADCQPAVVSLGVSEQYEGSIGGVRTFTVLVAASAAAGCTATGSVTVSTADQTATAPSDYTATSTTVSWAGETGAKTVSVPVVTDVQAEEDETFAVRLTAPSGVVIGQASGTVRLLDDDDPPLRTGVDGGKICWSIDRSTERATCPVTIRTSKPVRVPVTVRFRTHDLDGKAYGYVPVRDGLVTIPAGGTTGTAEIELRPAAALPEERFVLEVFAPSAGLLGAARAEVIVLGR
jgi:hypothetical protein